MTRQKPQNLKFQLLVLSNTLSDDPIAPNSAIELISCGCKGTGQLSLFLFQFLQKFLSYKERALVLR